MEIAQWILAGLTLLVGGLMFIFGFLPMAALAASRGYGAVALLSLIMELLAIALAVLVAFYLLPGIAWLYSLISSLLFGQ